MNSVEGRANGLEIQIIAMGSTVTFYTPEVNTTQVRGSQTYQGNTVGRIVGPPGVVTDGPNRARINSVYVVDPG